MEKIVERNMLYDFYGELLTPHQREVYEQVIFQDLSLSEAAELYGISRQGVHDLIRRCDKLLAGYEDKLHLAGRFVSLKSSVGQMYRMTRQYAESKDGSLLPQIERIYQKILEEL